MNCKHCNAPIPEDSVFCPECGKELEEKGAEVMEETVAEEVAAEETVEETVAEEAAAEEIAADSTEHIAVKSSKVFWILGSVLLGFQILVSSGNTNTGYTPFIGVTNWRVFLYDLVFFLSSNFVGVIGFVLLTIAAIRTFGAKKANANEPAAPAKTNTKKITVSVIAIVLLAAILIGLVAGSMGGKPVTEPTETPTVAEPEETKPVVIPFDGDPKSPLCKASYTVSDEQAMASADVVVATMGDKTLTNGELQAFYWQEIYMFLNEYGMYVDALGLDVYEGLDKQLMGGGELDEDDVSWQQFFLDGAIATWKNYQSLVLEAEAESYKMTAEEQEEIDNMPADMEEAAVSAGFANADELIRQNVGAACDLEAYLKYVTTYYHGMSYYYDYCGKLDPTDAEVEAFFEENEDEFALSGITRDTRFVDIRHVLLTPEGGEVGENGYPVYTDEAWDACRVKAEEIYNKWLEGDKSEDSFAQLAMDYSVDGNAAQGGIYEDVYVGQMVKSFEDWCFDESRVPGDHGLVKTEYGYHIMFFSAHSSWMDQVKEGLIDSLAYDKIPETTDKYPAEVDFSLVQLGNLNLA